ncbi:MAG TPA: alpha/beta hydrolase [Abditibacteriaceae bacterium]|jgi:acetyl esterase/lipase
MEAFLELDYAELLWPAGAPDARGETGEDSPAIAVFVPENPNGAAIVIFPGGGYSMRADKHEGRDIAHWFNARGITAFVVRYRVGTHGYRHPVPLRDAQRAIRWTRANAARFGLDSNRIGAMGFSAGGHLVSTLATHFDAGDANAAEEIERQSSRPDWIVLGYPVISFVETWAHGGSRNNLLGESHAEELAASLSNDRNVSPETPPTFLFHTDADAGVPSENSVQFYLALRRAKVPAELHIFETGGHGVGFAPDDAVLSTWPSLLEHWLRGRGAL